MTTGLWWFSAWFLLFGEVRARVLVPPAIITGVAMSVFAATATIWMPDLVTDNEAQFGFFGVALALVTWFSGAAIVHPRRYLRRARPGGGPRVGRQVHPRRRRLDVDAERTRRHSHHRRAS